MLLQHIIIYIRLVAKRVAEWDTHKFKSLPIDVNFMEYKSDTSSPEKSNKLLFSGVDEAIKDVLVLYLEDMFENLHVTDEIPGDDDSTVILEFHDSIGMEKLNKYDSENILK
jgi:hypothetical protein